jgi:hypothetical protein
MQAGSGNADSCLKGMLKICIEAGVHGLIVLVGKDILFFMAVRGIKSKSIKAGLIYRLRLNCFGSDFFRH